jgi:hypothetical protein
MLLILNLKRVINHQLVESTRKTCQTIQQKRASQHPSQTSSGTTLKLFRSTSLKTSFRKGKVIKGPNYDIQTLSTFDKVKRLLFRPKYLN